MAKGKRNQVAKIPRAPRGRYLVTFDKGSLRDRTESGLYLAADWDPGQNAEVIGTIVSCPLSGGVNGLQDGDEIAFSYQVAASEDTVDADMEHVYTEDTEVALDEEGRPGTSWSTRTRWSLARFYLQNDKYRGIQTNPEGFVVEEINKVSFGEWEAWHERLGKFRDSARPVRTNEFFWEGRTYYWVPADMIYAVRRGQLIDCVPGKMLTTQPAGMDADESGLIVTLARGAAGKAWVRVLIGPMVGSEVYVDPARTPAYNLWGKDVLVVRDDQVMAER